MKFKIRCESIKEFDATKNAYVKCHREVEVDSAQVGTLIRCPSCGNDVEVIDPSLLGSAAAAFSEREGASHQSDEAGESAASTESTTVKPLPISDEPVVDLLTELPSDSQPDSAAVEHHLPVSSAKTTATSHSGPDIELTKDSYQQTGGTVLRQATFDRTQTCHKCGTLLEEKQAICPNCKTQRRAAFVDKKDRKPFSRKGPFGFQLWLSGITRGPSKPNEIDWVGGVALVFSILLMGGGLVFFIFSGIAGKIVGPPMAFFGYGLFVAVRYWNAARQKPRTPIPWLGKIVWAVMLFFVRSMQFSKYNGARILNKNGDSDFGDRELASCRELAKCKVIDLEGTSITDEGLLYLYDRRGIDYLVICNTKVTEQAVQDLQQSIPKTWIWY